jgi:peptide/nickel transport system substrate-binding protein
MNKFIGVLFFITLALTQLVCVPATAEGIKKGGILRYATNNTCTTPGYTPECTTNASLIYLTTAYESLTYYDDSGKVIGKLAAKWETNPKEPSITWYLRKNVKFADGTPFNADAVKTNIEEYQKCNRNETKNVASCKVINDTTIKMVLKEWSSSTLESVGFFIYYMSPAALKDVNKLRNSSCGTGPFQVTEFKSGVSVKYTANRNYWQPGKPYLDGVEIDTVTEPTTRASAFQAGEYEILHMNNLTVAQQLIKDPKFILETNKSGQGLVGTGLIPNSSDSSSPFANVLVRQAMCYAIDSEALCKAFGYGMLIATNQWAAPNAVTYSKDVKGYPYNPAKAKQLLAQAGYPNGFSTTVTTDPGNKDIFTAAANMLSEVGIQCNINLVDESTQVKLYSTGTWKGIMGHFHSISPDLGLYMGRHLDKDAAFYAAGIQHPQDALALLGKIRIAPTETVKEDLEHQMQTLIYDKYALFGKPLFIQNEPVFKYSYVMDDGRGVDHVATWNIENCWLNK